MKPVIYQLVIRYFGNTNETNRIDGTIHENGCGKFDDITAAALAALKGLGVTHVWLTGALRHATLTDYSPLGLPADDPDIVKGRAGSFYAVRDYFDVCPDYATDPANRMAEFENLLRRIHEADLKTVIDLVPNHVARSYQSVIRPDLNFGDADDKARFFSADNNFFYLVDPPGRKLRLSKPADWNPAGVIFDGDFAGEDGALGRPPKATGDNVLDPTVDTGRWYETVKLNYGFNFADATAHYHPRPRTWDQMNEIVRYWQAKGVDGFRCDFAHYVPSEFWSWLISEARQRQPGASFFAEAYPWEGSRDPVTSISQLADAGFDAIYHDASYDILKSIYQGSAQQDDYDRQIRTPPAKRERLIEYLENHDERRIASPIVSGSSPDNSGFGSPDAGFQLAPLQFLCSRGPVLLLNGQEVGEAGAGREGYNGDDGRTTFFDYWCMPEFAQWTNGHAYDGGGLSIAQRELREFYADLLALCQDSATLGDGYWGLKYFNRTENFGDCPNDLYTFARFANLSGRLIVICANFRPNGPTTGQIRIPPELATVAGLSGNVRIHCILDRRGRQNIFVGALSLEELIDHGFSVSLPNQTTCVYSVAA